MRVIKSKKFNVTTDVSEEASEVVGRSWYEENSSEKTFAQYYEGQYRRRNDIILSSIKEFITEDALIFDAAAGSGYLMERVVTELPFKRYVWNDFNKKLHKYAKNRLLNLADKKGLDQHELLEKISFSARNMEGPGTGLADADIFICLSLEHIERDVRIISSLKEGCVAVICSPNFNSKGHFRHFEGVAEFSNRYKDYLNYFFELKLSNVMHLNRDRVPERYILMGVRNGYEKAGI